MARDRKQPRLKARSPVELAGPIERAHPGFLHQVLGQIAAGGEVDQIAQQPVVVLRDQPGDMLRIPSPNASAIARDSGSAASENVRTAIAIQLVYATSGGNYASGTSPLKSLRDLEVRSQEPVVSQKHLRRDGEQGIGPAVGGSDGIGGGRRIIVAGPIRQHAAGGPVVFEEHAGLV